MAPFIGRGRARSVVKFDMLVKDDIAFIVFDDVVAVQPSPFLIEVIFAFGPGEFLGG